MLCSGGMTVGGTEEVIHLSITDGFENCWGYDTETKEMCFSTYIKGFEINDENKLMVRGYVTFLCGEQEITVYSATVNRSVAGIRMLYIAKNRRQNLSAVLVIFKRVLYFE